jgi:hypothetical protein
MAVDRLVALSHNDTEDREVAKQFLELNGWYDIQMGGKTDLDLEVHKFKRGADVEQISYGMERFKSHNHFRIPYRKQKYWNEQDFNMFGYFNKYKEWYIDYIQFLNLSLTEFLWYDWRLIKEYHKNLYKDDKLPANWTTIEKTFITIPYQVGLERIKHYKLIDGKWNLVK